MVFVKITNGEVVYPYRGAKSLLGIYPPGQDKTNTFITLSVKAKAKDDPKCKIFMFKKCVMWTEDQNVINMFKNMKEGNIVEIEGSENRTCKKGQDGQEDQWYDQIVIKKCTPISEGVTNNHTYNAPSNNNNIPINDNDLPF